MTVNIEADSKKQAKEIAFEKWSNSEYILTADNFENVSFKVKKAVNDFGIIQGASSDYKY